MDNKAIEEKTFKKQYLFVIIFLIVLVAVLAIIILTSKQNRNSVLQSSNPSAIILDETTSTEKTNVPSEEVSDNTKMDKVTELQIVDEKVGNGEEATVGKTVTVNYVGTLIDGTKFDSSYDRNQPFSFTLGVGQVIEGWDKGVLGMKVGGKRKLTIPSSLGYGDSGIPGVIPGGATLVFEVELLKVE